ncbi:MAG: hypothetical protein KAS94_03860 [Desulfobulbaceae bacterium]|nr:hypothetical protein [Desulfobulbaceae bacterium]
MTITPTKNNEQRIKPQEAGPQDIAIVPPLLMEPDHLLRNNDFKAMDFLALLKTHLSGAGLEDILERIDQHITKFDFEAARQGLDQITNKLQRASREI